MIVINCKHVGQNEEALVAEEVRKFLNDKGHFPNTVKIISKSELYVLAEESRDGYEIPDSPKSYVPTALVEKIFGVEI